MDTVDNLPARCYDGRRMAGRREELLSAGGVAKLAGGVSLEAVRQWALRGLLPVAMTVGGRRMFRRRDVERFLKKRAAR